MKLTQAQTNVVKDNLGLNAVEEGKEIQQKLEGAFGEHTFFLGDKGLFVFEEEPKAANGKANRARLFVVAAWTGEDKTALAPVDPFVEAGVVFDLEGGVITGGE